jgi:ArsR family transcriptional regulator, arsenate/arsenite/antimonite-responsive transcriptional repressor
MPRHWRIRLELARRGTCICGDIVDALPLAQSTVSQHLKALKEAGLIQGEIEGPRSCYCLRPEAIQVLVKGLSALAKTLAQPKCC